MCVFMCTCVDSNMHTWVYAFTCTLQYRRATPLSSQLWPTYSYTHSADPTSVHAACSGHCGSTHLLPHTHTKWATAGLSSLHTTGCSFTLMKCKVSADSIFTHIIHTDKCTITQKLLSPPFFCSSYSFKRWRTSFTCKSTFSLCQPVACYHNGKKRNHQNKQTNLKSDFRLFFQTFQPFFKPKQDKYISSKFPSHWFEIIQV